MAAREGCLTLIQSLRSMTHTEENSESLNGVALWTNDALQDYLDKFATELLDAPLTVVPLYESGVMEYHRFFLPVSVGVWVEEPTLLDNQFHIVDHLGYEIASTEYTFYSERREVFFTADQLAGGTKKYLRGRKFDLNRTAATIWFEKAAQRAHLVEIMVGKHRVKEDTEWQQSMAMYMRFSAKGGLRAVKLQRQGYSHGRDI